MSRMRNLAHIALKQYGIENAKLTLLNDTENMLFRVDAQVRYTLRVYHCDSLEQGAHLVRTFVTINTNYFIAW